MKLEHISAEELKERLAHIFAAHLDPHGYRAFFFGSRVSGTSGERSDIDLGIEGQRALDPAAKAAILEAIENLPILYTIDLVDFATVRPEFRKKALKHTEPIQWKIN